MNISREQNNKTYLELEYRMSIYSRILKMAMLCSFYYGHILVSDRNLLNSREEELYYIGLIRNTAPFKIMNNVYLIYSDCAHGLQ